jgi:hypothetical protein
MNERRIESLPSLPFGAVTSGLVCIASLVVGAVLGNIHYCVFALAPGLLTIAFWNFRARPIAFEIADDGLHIESQKMDIPYASIESIYLNGKLQDFNEPNLKSGDLLILHEKGYLEIPARLSVPVVDLYRFLGAVVPPRGSGSVHSELSAHLQNEETVFGPERVYAFSTRTSKGTRSARFRMAVYFGLLMFCGIVWAVCGGTFLATRLEPSPWMFVGILLAVFSGLFMILAMARSLRYGIREKLKNSSMIISPTGVALLQGDLKGQVRWDELRDIRFRPKMRSFIVSNEENMTLVPGIQLIVPGACIDIYDIYNRPLTQIYHLLLRYWKGDEQPPCKVGDESDLG